MQWVFLHQSGFVSQFTLAHSVTVACAVAREQSVADLAGMLHQYNEMPVIDGTGMTDKFDSMLEYSVGLAAKYDTEPVDALDPSRVLTQQLGCRSRGEKRLSFCGGGIDRPLAHRKLTSRRAMRRTGRRVKALRTNGIQQLLWTPFLWRLTKGPLSGQADNAT
jgi:hypothetical protein